MLPWAAHLALDRTVVGGSRSKNLEPKKRTTPTTRSENGSCEDKRADRDDSVFLKQRAAENAERVLAFEDVRKNLLQGSTAAHHQPPAVLHPLAYSTMRFTNMHLVTTSFPPPPSLHRYTLFPALRLRREDATHVCDGRGVVAHGL